MLLLSSPSTRSNSRLRSAYPNVPSARWTPSASYRVRFGSTDVALDGHSTVLTAFERGWQRDAPIETRGSASCSIAKARQAPRLVWRPVGSLTEVATLGSTEFICPICHNDTLGCRQRDDEVFCNGPERNPPKGYRHVRDRMMGTRVYKRAEAADNESPKKALLQIASDITEQTVSWLWLSRLETGTLNLLAGDPGVGKSLLTTTIAAVVSRGGTWPDRREDSSAEAANVILVTAEDDPARATVPRLRAAGADLKRVAILRAVEEEGERRQVCLQRDLAMVRRVIREFGNVALLVIDPVDSYMGSTDTNVNEQVRKVLEPLLDLAEQSGVCALAVKHLNKAVNSMAALYRVAGSTAFTALSRTVHAITRDPKDKSRMLFMPLKVSHDRKPGALAYRITQTDDGLPTVTWDAGAVNVDADDVLAHRNGPPAPVTDQAMAWLRTVLAEGPILSTELEDMADAAGITAATLKLAKKRLGVVAAQVRERGKLVGWSASLPKGAS